MAKFRLHIIKIRRAKNGNKYVITRKQNLNCPWVKDEVEYFLFSNNAVKCYEPYLSIANGGVSDVDKQIPEEYLIIEGGYFDFRPEQKFFQKYVKDDFGNNIRKGDYIRSIYGNVVVFETLRVFCRYYQDELGHTNFEHKQSPAEVGMREYMYCCIPYSIEMERELNRSSHLYCELDNDNRYLLDSSQSDNYESNEESLYYNDSIDMDQQSQSYWEDLGVF